MQVTIFFQFMKRIDKSLELILVYPQTVTLGSSPSQIRIYPRFMRYGAFIWHNTTVNHYYIHILNMPRSAYKKDFHWIQLQSLLNIRKQQEDFR